MTIYSVNEIEEINLRNEKERLSREIFAEIGSAKCSSDNSCKTIGFGSKSCGGPSTYLIFSQDSSNEASLNEKIKKYNELDSRNNRTQGLISTCDISISPSVFCSEQKCVKYSGLDIRDYSKCNLDSECKSKFLNLPFNCPIPRKNYLIYSTISISAEKLDFEVNLWNRVASNPNNSMNVGLSSGYQDCSETIPALICKSNLCIPN